MIDGRELEEKVKREFAGFNDIEVLSGDESKYYFGKEKKSLMPDIIIKYGRLPFAIIEVKSNVKPESIVRKQFDSYKSITSIPTPTPTPITCYIAKIDDNYYYYSDEDNKLLPQSFTEILKKLMDALENGEKDASDEKKLLESTVASIKNENFGQYKLTFKERLDQGGLMKHGNILFLKRETEINLMRSLLENESSQEGTFCRYISAKWFLESLKSNSFRLNRIETMNDALETRVIEDYDKLKDTKGSVNEALFRGYIMCFSDEERKDKLYNWYMYGDQAKGVCFTVKKRDEHNIKCKNGENYVFAPVVYVEREGDKTKCPLLDFLNEIMDKEVGDYIFKFRLWHYWKYFFKYDFYEEEKETRLVWIAPKDKSDDSQSPVCEWNDHYEIPCYHIEKKFDKLPFEIDEIILGPKCGDNDFAQEVFTSISKLDKEKVKRSAIKGFRG